jgi:hypothetical protein
MKVTLPSLADCKRECIAELEAKGIKWRQAQTYTKLGALVAALRHGATADGKEYADYYDSPSYRRAYVAIMVEIANTYPSLATIAKKQTANKLATCGIY